MQRFWAKVDKSDDCWIWLASKHPAGYGQFAPNGKQIGAHRFAYQALVGPIPEGMTLDHLCRNRACVNPAHLEPVSRGENTLRGETITAANLKKTYCSKGHPYDESNTIRKKCGRRRCRSCHAEWNRNYMTEYRKRQHANYKSAYD